jgi:hypothetical protein
LQHLEQRVNVVEASAEVARHFLILGVRNDARLIGACHSIGGVVVLRGIARDQVLACHDEHLLAQDEG